MLSENFVYVGALLGFVGQVTYLTSTVRGYTQPNRVTWFLWGVAPLLAFAGTIDEGVGVQALMTFMVGFGPLCIFVASFVNPNAFWKITRLDVVCGALSVIGLLFWLATREGNVAIAAGLAADGLAAIPTIVKAYRHPTTEHPWLFWASGVNGLLVLLTIDRWDFAHYAFPGYIAVLGFALGALVSLRQGAARMDGNGDGDPIMGDEFDPPART